LHVSSSFRWIPHAQVAGAMVNRWAIFVGPFPALASRASSTCCAGRRRDGCASGRRAASRYLVVAAGWASSSKSSVAHQGRLGNHGPLGGRLS
jgi:hypothetical protein